MNNSLISIIIPTYNRAYLISETLDSVIAQTYTNWECIVVDDGSTDNTAEILNQYCEKDTRFQYHHRPKNRLKGGNAARNYGFELSKGEYIKWFDSDDLMKKFFLETQIKILESNSELDFCASRWEIFSEKNNTKEIMPKLFSKNPIYDFFFEEHIFMTPSPLWKRNFLKDKKIFDELLFRSQESDFHFRMLLMKPNYIYIDKVCFSVRRGHNSIDENSLNEQPMLSVLRYFFKVSNLLREHRIQNEKLNVYIIKRIYKQIYAISRNHKHTFLAKFKFYFNNIGIMTSAINKIPILKFVYLFIGLNSLLFFNKGHRILKNYENRIQPK